MALTTCGDGRVLAVDPVPVLARDGVPYEVVLRLQLDGAPWGEVGERCGWFLQEAADRLAAGPRAAGFGEAGVRAWASATGADPDTAWAGLARHLPRDRELFSFRRRDPDDPPGAGALRAVVDERRTFGAGGWRSSTCVRLEAWGDDGTGVSAELGVPAATAWLAGLLAEVAEVGARLPDGRG